MNRLYLSLLALVVMVAGGCASPSGKTAALKRDTATLMRDAALTSLYARHPEARDVIKKSYGYAVMDRDDVMVLLFGGGGGYGVATETATGHRYYLEDWHMQLGLGLGYRNLRGVIVFADRETYDRFMGNAWVFGGEAEIAATWPSGGFDASTKGNLGKGMSYYQFTQTGGALQADLPLTQVTDNAELATMVPLTPLPHK